MVPWMNGHWDEGMSDGFGKQVVNNTSDLTFTFFHSACTFIQSDLQMWNITSVSSQRAVWEVLLIYKLSNLLQISSLEDYSLELYKLVELWSFICFLLFFYLVELWYKDQMNFGNYNKTQDGHIFTLHFSHKNCSHVLFFASGVTKF